MQIEHASLWKNTNKKKDTHPDYRLTTKIDDSYEEIGAAWIKNTEKGDKYFSIKFKDNIKVSYIIDLGKEEKKEGVVPIPEGMEYPKEEINPEDIPF